MLNKGPDVVSEDGLRELLSLGHQAVVICSEAPVQKSYFWHGLWHIVCVSLDGRSERLLVSARRDAQGSVKPREFRTVNGLISFLHGLGVRMVTVPMEEGGRVGHTLLHHGPTNGQSANPGS